MRSKVSVLRVMAAAVNVLPGPFVFVPPAGVDDSYVQVPRDVLEDMIFTAWDAADPEPDDVVPELQVWAEGLMRYMAGEDTVKFVNTTTGNVLAGSLVVGSGPEDTHGSVYPSGERIEFFQLGLLHVYVPRVFYNGELPPDTTAVPLDTIGAVVRAYRTQEPRHPWVGTLVAALTGRHYTVMIPGEPRPLYIDGVRLILYPDAVSDGSDDDDDDSDSDDSDSDDDDAQNELYSVREQIGKSESVANMARKNAVMFLPRHLADRIVPTDLPIRGRQPGSLKTICKRAVAQLPHGEERGRGAIGGGWDRIPSWDVMTTTRIVHG
jgi:hypothetical protein